MVLALSPALSLVSYFAPTVAALVLIEIQVSGLELRMVSSFHFQPTSVLVLAEINDELLAHEQF